VPKSEREFEPVLHLLSHDDLIWVVVLVREGIGGGRTFILDRGDGWEPFCVEGWVGGVETGVVRVWWNCGGGGGRNEDQGKLWGMDWGFGVCK